MKACGLHDCVKCDYRLMAQRKIYRSFFRVAIKAVPLRSDDANCAVSVVIHSLACLLILNILHLNACIKRFFGLCMATHFHVFLLVRCLYTECRQIECTRTPYIVHTNYTFQPTHSKCNLSSLFFFFFFFFLSAVQLQLGKWDNIEAQLTPITCSQCVRLKRLRRMHLSAFAEIERNKSYRN